MRRKFITIGAVCISAAVLSFGILMEKGKSVDTVKPLRVADSIITVVEKISRINAAGEGSDEKVDPEVSEKVEMDKAKEYVKKEMSGNKSSEKRNGNSQSKSIDVYKRQRMNRIQQQFRDMLYSLSASIAAGRQMDEAITEAEENLAVLYSSSDLIMKELQYMRVNIKENKESDKLLLKDFAFRSKSEDINNFVQVYITCRSMGGNMEKVIEHTTEILTDKMTIEREIKTVTAQKKLEGRIISVMPLLMLILMKMCIRDRDDTGRRRRGASRQRIRQSSREDMQRERHTADNR